MFRSLQTAGLCPEVSTQQQKRFRMGCGAPGTLGRGTGPNVRPPRSMGLGAHGWNLFGPNGAAWRKQSGEGQALLWSCVGGNAEEGGMYPGAYRLCGKQDLNWATAWSTAADWCLLQSPCFSHGRLERGVIELHANNRGRTIAPCLSNETILLFTVTAWHGLLDLAVPGCIMEGFGR